MLRIQRCGNGKVVLTVSGRLEADNVSEFSALLSAEPMGRPLVLDLKDAFLVDRDIKKRSKRGYGTGLRLRTIQRKEANMSQTPGVPQNFVRHRTNIETERA